MHFLMSGFDDLFLGIGGEQDLDEELRLDFFVFALYGLGFEQQFDLASALGFGDFGRERLAVWDSSGLRLSFMDGM